MTARFGYLDFFDPDNPPGPQGQLSGVTQSQSTFGVNWYLSDQLRILFNYSYVLSDEPNTGTSAASIFGMRLAVIW